MVLGLEPRSLCIRGRHSTTELILSPKYYLLLVIPSVEIPPLFVVKDLSGLQRVRCSCHLPLLLMTRLGAVRDAGSHLWKGASHHVSVELADAFCEMLVSVTGKTEERNGV